MDISILFPVTLTNLKFTFPHIFKVYVTLPLGIAFAFVCLCYVRNKIRREMEDLLQAIKNLADGDLDVRVNPQIEKRDDELGRLAIYIKSLAGKLRDITGNMAQIVDTLVSSSSLLEGNSTKLAKSGDTLAATAQEVSSSVEEMTANLKQTSENAQNTRKISESTFTQLQVISSSSKDAMESVQKIVNKINIINEIARQTNILALNAAIEAARAGESGEGFAVVAAEVRKLAEPSQKAAVEIDELSKMTLETTQNFVGKIQSIIPDIQATTTLINEISVVTRELESGAMQVTNAAMQLYNLSQENANSGQELNKIASTLYNNSMELEKSVGYFKQAVKSIPKSSSFLGKTPSGEMSKRSGLPINSKSQLGTKGPIPESTTSKSGGIDLDLWLTTDEDFVKF